MATNPELDQKLVENQTQAQTPTVTLEVNVNELNVVFAGLQELPHRVVDVLIRKLMEQAQRQVNG